ncbi:non-ribosomal peptide synthetase [Pseudoalteromonas luteoviolacea]|uniref:Carrier domain-containing protein n=1 Tax=Pseudoalteromonas luteoviolacea DSM 6061 TaxID=1365250 RepID=A0A166XME8_9GAMM|nr:non-ribosomal peptide synthetase [Pseudoalteromonas luteoviolacea]KZN40564.1 hypothetical protein N475_11470 [Pseudoalteromonas luteoviolacea DSM 6061]MBE0389657.1 hypothetical protein [Pseudoalteromonas luteoviolacea DSM 6061]
MNNTATSSEFSNVMKYWDEKLDNLPDALVLGTNSASNGERISAHHVLDGALSASLLKACKQNDLSLFVMLNAITKVTLFRAARQSDDHNRLLLSSPVYKLADSDGRKGVPLLDNVSEEQTLRDVLLSSQKTITSAYQHQHLPFDAALKCDGVNANPFHIITSFNALHRDEDLAALQNDYENALTLSFELQGEESSKTVVCRVDAQDSMFIDAELAEQFLGWFEQVAQCFISDNQLLVAQIGLLGEAQQLALRDLLGLDVSLPAKESYSSISQLFAQQVEANPVKPAIIEGDKQISFIELDQLSNQYACAFVAAGVETSDIVAVQVSQSTEVITMILALWKIGAVYLPIDPELPVGRISYMLEDSNAKVVVSKNALGLSNVIDISPAKLSAFELTEAPDFIELSPEHPAYIIYTSGSTGQPKGVKITHCGVANLAGYFVDNLGIKTEDRILQFASMSFDASIWEISMGVLTGAALCLYPQDEKNDTAAFAQFMVKHEVNVATLPPPFLALLEPAQLPGLRLLITAGSVCSTTLAQRWSSEVTFINAYGPTETTVCATSWTYNEDEALENSVPIGRAIDNFKTYILNDAMQLQPQGCYGEIYISGSGLALEYLNRPELTAERFVENPFYAGEKLYRTGDIGRYRKGGVIEFLGRDDDQIKIRGMRVEIGEIEGQLTQHKLVSQTSVQLLSQDGSEDNLVLTAYITLVESNDKSAYIDEALSKQLHECLEQQLPSHMIPSFFVVMPVLPLTLNDKVDKKVLPTPKSLIERTNLPQPQTPTETSLRKIWAPLLGLDEEQIGIDSDFFKLGGNSIMATETANLINKELNVVVDLFDIFNIVTIRDMAAHLDQLTGTVHNDIPLVGDLPHYPLSPAQRRLYFLYKMAPQSTSYNVPSIQLLEGGVDCQQIETALAKLLERHASLRTAFIDLSRGNSDQDKGQSNVVQKVITDYTLPITYRDISDFKVEGEPSDDNYSQILSQCIEPFDLAEAPLLRLYLIKESEQRHLLITDVHHIVADGTSVGILVRDFITFYQGKDLEPLNHQYTDFSQWQNDKINGKDYQKQESYWIDLLKDDIPTLRIPTDRPRPSVMTFAGDTVKFVMSSELSNKVHKFVEQQNITPYMFFLGAFNVLLHKYSDKDDIVIGTGIAGRNHASLKDIMGMFVNTLAMRNRFDRNTSVAQFLQQVRTNSIQAFEYQDVQFDDLIDKLGYERDTSRNPVFDYSMVFQNFEMPELSLEGIKFSPVVQHNSSSKFDLTMFISQRGNDQFEFTLEYYSEIFEKTTVEGFGAHLRYLVEQMVSGADSAICDLRLMTPEFEQQWLQTIGANPDSAEQNFPLETPISEFFEQHAKNNPDHTAVIHKGVHYSYKTINEQANQLAHFLTTERQVQREELVAIYIDRSHWYLIALLAVMKSGGAYMPLDSSLPADRMQYLLEQASVRTVLSVKDFVGNLNKLQWNTAGLESFVLVDHDDVYSLDENTQNTAGLRSLWEYVGENAADDIGGGGWSSTYTGYDFTRQEMDEYGENIVTKLKPLLTPQTRILEIGCASGITMYRLAPHVAKYVGTDISRVIIEKNEKRCEQEGHNNISLYSKAAHEIAEVDESEFDIVIINSVIQSFEGLNYLRKVLSTCVDKLNDKGLLFLGDLMDQDLKSEFLKDLLLYKDTGRSEHVMAELNKQIDERPQNTKTDLSEELYISRHFLEDLLQDIPALSSVEFTDKLGTFKNELTEFRFDALISVDKQAASSNSANAGKRNKYQYGRQAFAHLSTENLDNTGRFAADGSQLAYVLFTSGSTGTPKGVEIENRSLVSFAFANRISLENDVTSDDRFLVNLSQAFDVNMCEVFLPWVFGATLVMSPKQHYTDIEALTALIVKEKVTAAWVPAALLKDSYRLLAASTETLSLNKLLIGAEPIKSSTVRALQSLNNDMKILNIYGPTECTVYASCSLWSEAPGSVTSVDSDPNMSIGRARPDAEILILNSNMEQVAPGITGEIYIGGNCVMRGYLNRPDMNEKVLLPHPFKGGETVYKTGDLAKFTDDGEIVFLGREDSQIKLRGMRVELGEIEMKLAGHPSVHQCVVVMENKEDPYIAAYYVGKEGDENTIDSKKLTVYLAERLPYYMVPSFICPVESLPTTLSGKIDYRALASFGAAYRIQSSQFDGSTMSEHEIKMAKLWSKVLGIEASQISPNTDFFLLGGHSLRAIRLVGEVQKEFKVNLPLATLFQTPTIRDICAYIEGQEKIDYMDIPALEKQENYELSSSQKSMFIVQGIKEGSFAYNMPALIKVEGNFDFDKVKACFEQLIERHEPFRTSFSVNNEGDLIQTIHDSIPFGLEFQQAEAGETIESLFAGFLRPFDLAAAPLLRAKIIKLANDEGGIAEQSLLFVDMNHIISDGSSVSLFIEEFSKLYNGKTLEPLTIQYKDFAHWQNRLLDSPQVKAQEKYWQKTLAQPLPSLSLPTDFPRPEIQSFEGDQQTMIFDKALSSKIKAMAQDNEMTVFMLLLSSAYVFLQQITLEQDIVIGTSLVGRDHADLRNVMGMFVNTLALRNQPKSSLKVIDFIKSVRSNTIEAFDNKQVQFERLVDLLKLPRDPSRNPVFDVRFDMHEMEMPTIELDGVKVTGYEPEFKSSKFDLTFDVFEKGGKYVIRLEYCTKLFKDSTIEAFLTQYRQVTEYILDNPNGLIGDIDTFENESDSHVPEMGFQF